jgi:hypothetical protein
MLCVEELFLATAKCSFMYDQSLKHLPSKWELGFKMMFINGPRASAEGTESAARSSTVAEP